MMRTGPGRTVFNIAIALLALALSARCDSKGTDSLTGADMPGTMSVVVTSTVPVGAAATVTLTGPVIFVERTANTSFGTTLTFSDLPPGTYTVAVSAIGFSCQPVSVLVRELHTTAVTVTCTRMGGTVTGTVRGGGSPIDGAAVMLTRTGFGLTRTTGASGTFTFDVAAGEYEVTAFHQHHDCPIQTVLVEQDQTTTADFSCTPKTTGSIAGSVIIGLDPGFYVPGATVSLSGPESRTATAGFGNFSFDGLPPGTYTVAATAGVVGCQSVNVDVEAARTTTVQISCAFRDYPFGSEIQGNWEYSRQLSSQTGTCPQALPDRGTGSMTFNSNNNTITMAGLDPELTIIGPYDEGTGLYMGTGSAVLGDGSSIQTDVTVTFSFPGPWDYGYLYFSGATPSHGMIRRHRDPGGNLVCTEIYTVGGGR
jgi:hypothetical protein